MDRGAASLVPDIIGKYSNTYKKKEKYAYCMEISIKTLLIEDFALVLEQLFPGCTLGIWAGGALTKGRAISGFCSDGF